MQRRNLIHLYRDEFTGYNVAVFRQDLLAGLTVAAVALPLALAFGVASGATAAAGLVTAILAGLVIGALSGAPYQISGPTGAMSAVLILLVQRYGLQGIWIAGLMAGVLLLIIGLLRLGYDNKTMMRALYQLEDSGELLAEDERGRLSWLKRRQF